MDNVVGLVTICISVRGINLRPDDFDFISIFVQGLSNVEVIVAVIGFISAAAFAGVWVTKFGRLILPQPQESRLQIFYHLAN